MELNQCVFLGNLTRDAEVRDTKTSKVLKFGLAVNSKRGGDEEVLFLTVEMWGEKLVDALEKYLTRGKQVLVSGRLKMNEYETKDGEKRRDLILVANQVSLGSDANRDHERNSRDREDDRRGRDRDRRDDDRDRGGRASSARRYDD